MGRYSELDCFYRTGCDMPDVCQAQMRCRGVAPPPPPQPKAEDRLLAILRLEKQRLDQLGEETFDDAWARKRAEGYQFGADALELVRMGWNMARGK